MVLSSADYEGSRPGVWVASRGPSSRVSECHGGSVGALRADGSRQLTEDVALRSHLRGIPARHVAVVHREPVVVLRDRDHAPAALKSAVHSAASNRSAVKRGMNSYIRTAIADRRCRLGVRTPSSTWRHVADTTSHASPSWRMPSEVPRCSWRSSRSRWSC